MDMPESCRECPLHERSIHFDKSLCVPMEKLYDKFVDKKPSWCPLREVPEKKEVCGKYPQADKIPASYKVGYNACIDEILGKDV